MHWQRSQNLCDPTWLSWRTVRT